MSGIGKIVKDHGTAGNDPKDAKKTKEEKEKVAEIVKELVGDDTQAQPKRGPGRPPKRTPPPSPGRKQPAADTQVPPTSSRESSLTPAQRMANQMHIHRLNRYRKKFPEYERFFVGYDPVLAHPDDNKRCIDAFLDLIHSEIEDITVPAMIDGGLDTTEDAAMAWAIENPGHPASRIIADLQGVTTALKNDRAVSLDRRLLECEITGLMPKNPKLRMLLNAGRVMVQHVMANRRATVEPPSSSSTKDAKFKDF